MPIFGSAFVRMKFGSRTRRISPSLFPPFVFFCSFLWRVDPSVLPSEERLKTRLLSDSLEAATASPRSDLSVEDGIRREQGFLQRRSFLVQKIYFPFLLPAIAFWIC
ncbi:hypothetical protein V6N12_069343 [Hibiscus sabdariffa]|uniref:Transmembrane protein n=1 Tax=Hibiscus sabdariffa TaxID=183260 RepID=A0ABR2FDM4_9ROSI